MKLVGADVYLVKWPLKLAVEHNLARNDTTGNLIVRLTAQGGLTGFGEGVPRFYVTGETTEAALDFLRSQLLPSLIGLEFDPRRSLDVMSSHFSARAIEQCPAAACAVETALMDLAGRRLNLSLADLLGEPSGRSLTYSAILPLAGPEKTRAVLAMIKSLNLSQVKVKVGRQGAYERAALARNELGAGARLRLDANGAWTAEQAVREIEAMEGLNLEAVEQPVAKEDYKGLAFVKSRTIPVILADESLCTLSEARRLIDEDCVGGFNLRLSKCGGPFRTKIMLEMARDAGLVCQLGSQVGELGILSAAGRHFADCNPDLVYLEGSLTHYVVGQDVLFEDISFGQNGAAKPLLGPGLGVEVRLANFAESFVFSIH